MQNHPSSRPPARPAGRGLLVAVLVFAAVAAATLAGVRVVRAGDGGPDIPIFNLVLLGPDVTVIELGSVVNHGAAGGVRAYSLGTNSCNRGDQPLDWCNENGPDGCGGGTTDEDHPVIAQNLYRLADGRFQQIGMSWLKHGFRSTNDFDPACGDCQQPPLGGDQLGVGCTDTYDADINGNRPLGRRSQVNAATGAFPYPYGKPPTPDVTSQRIRVAESDLLPAQNPGARYFMEGHYVSPDDAAAGNGFNNASHREVAVAGGSLDLEFVGETVTELPAIAAWPLADPAVELVPVDVPGSQPLERFHVARKATPIAGGWHYEYAVHNLNSDRSARRFSVRFPSAVTISNPGFHSIAHHSGEPYSTAPWTVDVAARAVTWSTATFGGNANANALRWGTTFNFWFDATAGPDGITHSLGLFKPGTPGEIAF